MKSASHLFVAVSGHGYGHLAQVAPVLNALRRKLPALRLTVQCALPPSVLQSRLQGDFRQLPEATDFGMLMTDAVGVKTTESLTAYRTFHADWTAHRQRQETLLAECAPDLLLADIPYLPLAAAARLGLPAVALCCLHWADILRFFCPRAPDLAELRATMLAAYNSAAVFLKPAPSMPLPDLTNARSIGPVATLGRNRRDELCERLRLPSDATLVLIALGGIGLRLPLERWPAMPNVRWLVPASWQVQRADAVAWEAADMRFVDLVCSCDVLLTKTGYGSYTEAACNGTPVLYLARDNWPEEPWLSRWLTAQGNALPVSRAQLESGTFGPVLEALLAQPRKPAVVPSGVAEAVACLAGYLRS